jgi:ATP-grasp domain
MLRVRFGNHEGWHQEIATRIDRTRFEFQFGDLRSADFADFDCVVPLNLPDYEVLKNNMAFFGKKFWCPIPSIVDICDDKLVFNQLLLRGEFGELVPSLLASRSGEFPYIIKKRRDGFGENSFIIRNSADERALVSLLDSPEYFSQFYIAGSEEYALHVLMANDEVAYARTVKYEFGNRYYVKGMRFKFPRVTYLADNEHISTFSRILVTLGYTGTCCINYKMHGGVPNILEINPRFGASLIGDINQYLDAYLNTLGALNEAVFYESGVPHALDKSRKLMLLTLMRGMVQWLLSRMPYRIWRLLQMVLDAKNRLFRALKARLSG